jgi:SAM-dependent methyltransferase
VNVPDGRYSRTGLWQLVESGCYEADLETWRDLASRASTPVLDLGCGIGRVCHWLNRSGFTAWGLDRNPDLIADFDHTRPRDSPPGITCDATSLEEPPETLRSRRFELVIAPQQLVQIIGGHERRIELFRGVSQLLEDGGLAAFAICEQLPQASIEYPDVPPDLREVDGWVHSSQPTAIEPTSSQVTAVRIRQSLSPDGTVERSEDRVTLDRLDRTGIEQELTTAGLLPAGTGVIEQTDRHMGSTLVLARQRLS